MTPTLQLHIRLKSDTTFGRGDGVPGDVDIEVQHDALGLPCFGGRALKGVLAIECADLLYALGQQKGARWWNAAAALFGAPGSTGDVAGALAVGDARLPESLRQAVAYAECQGLAAHQALAAHQVLAALTTTRKQTANDIETGAPKDETLRAMRVVLRETEFVASLQFRADVSDDALALLAACVAALRRLGTGRNRGCGEVECWLTDGQGDKVTAHLERFIREVRSA